MSNTPTTPTDRPAPQDHAAEIMAHVQDIWEDHPEDDETLAPKVSAIRNHADALVAERDEWKDRAIRRRQMLWDGDTARRRAEDDRDALAARCAALDDDALVDIVAEAMWSPYFGNNRKGQSFQERDPRLTASWRRKAQNAVAAMRQFVDAAAPDRPNRDGAGEGT